MTTKWISQIFSGMSDSGAKTASPPPAAQPASPPPAHPAAPAENSIPADDNALLPGADRPIDGEQDAPDSAEQDNAIDMSKVDLNKFVVILLYGKNSFGDKIYSYLKITLGGIEKLKAAVLVGMPFNPSDFGTIIAAGKGEPSDEVRAEIANMYYVLTAQAEPPPKAVTVTEKKAWDEY